VLSPSLHVHLAMAGPNFGINSKECGHWLGLVQHTSCADGERGDHERS
jgi:hypothetical protein